MRAIFLAIPAPGVGDDPWGRRFRLYGIAIALGVLAALEMARRRWQARGGDPEDMSTLALWVVPAGLIGARAYHVLTDRVTYAGHWFDNPFDATGQSPLAIWRGGLGIPGALLFGLLATLWVTRRRGMRAGSTLDALIPGVPLAQAIGRLGNYFNQELFGRPTDLPWGLEVAPQFRPPEYFDAPTFHPTFLYEGLWNLGLMGVLLWVDKRWKLRPGRLTVLYVGGYFTGRLWVEALRSDEAKTIIAGLRINSWISLLAMATVVAIVAIGGLRRRSGDDDGPYLDGHRFDPDAPLDVDADADADTGSDPEAGGEEADGEAAGEAADEATGSGGAPEPAAPDPPETSSDTAEDPTDSDPPPDDDEPDDDEPVDDQRGTRGDEVKSDTDP
jgi:prolipoprotein diacylglyceryl transferase